MSGSLRTFTPVAWRNLWRNPRRTVITLIVVSVGLWSVLVFNSFMNAWMQSSKDGALQLLIGSGQIHAEGYMDDPSLDTLMDKPNAALSAALNAPEVKFWTTRLAVPGVIQSEYKTLPINIMGVDPAAELKISSIPGKVVQGRYLNGVEDESIVLGLHLAERLKTQLGRRIILMSQRADGSLAEQSFNVVGLFDADQATEDFYAFTGIDAANEFLGLTDRIAQVVIALPDDGDVDAVFETFRVAAPDLDVRTWRQLNLFLASSDSFMNGFIYIWLGVVFSLMAIGIVNTQLMAVFERTQEFGLLLALGMKPRLVLLMVSLESAMLIGSGVLLGVAISSLTIWTFYSGIDLSVFEQALEMFQGGQVLYPKFDVQKIVIFSLIIWVLGILVALWPARRAAKSIPVEAMRRAT